jgi:prepilin-type processing-associated H-X9-DG protein/prepilin-type N-terminal cleavage/methylation domain-containing protein
LKLDVMSFIRSQLDPEQLLPKKLSSEFYRILFIGDSITCHGTNKKIQALLGWDRVAGMAASSEQADFAHRFSSLIQSFVPGKNVECHFHTSGKSGTAADRLAALKVVEPVKPDLVIVQLGEHEKESIGELAFRESYENLLDSIKNFEPTPQIICTGVWEPEATRDETGEGRVYHGWPAQLDRAMEDACGKYEVPFVSVATLALDPSCHGAGEHPGVKWHPNDRGHEGYAQRLLEAFAQVCQTTQESKAAGVLKVRRNAFTLIELLVVVGIIAILGALAFPALTHAIVQAKTAACLSNLHQIGVLSTMYSGDNNNLLVPICVGTGAGDGETWRGLLQPYTTDPSMKLFQCPVDPNVGAQTTLDPPTYRFPTSYGINDTTNLHQYLTSQLQSARTTAVKSPASTIFVTDIGMIASTSVPAEQWQESSYPGDSYGYATFPGAEYGWNAGQNWSIVPRHGGKANALFYDGHASTLDMQNDIIAHPPGDPDCLYDDH